MLPIQQQQLRRRQWVREHLLRLQISNWKVTPLSSKSSDENSVLESIFSISFSTPVITSGRVQPVFNCTPSSLESSLTDRPAHTAHDTIIANKQTVRCGIILKGTCIFLGFLVSISVQNFTCLREAPVCLLTRSPANSWASWTDYDIRRWQWESFQRPSGHLRSRVLLEVNCW